MGRTTRHRSAGLCYTAGSRTISSRASGWAAQLSQACAQPVGARVSRSPRAPTPRNHWRAPPVPLSLCRLRGVHSPSRGQSLRHDRRDRDGGDAHAGAPSRLLSLQPATRPTRSPHSSRPRCLCRPTRCCFCRHRHLRLDGVVHRRLESNQQPRSGSRRSMRPRSSRRRAPRC